LVSDQPQKSEELLAVLQRLEAPPGTPTEAASVVLEAMRQNLLLSTLREQLTPAQDRLLRAACLYRVSVNEDGLRAIESQLEQAESNWQRLMAYALLEIPYDPELDLQYFVVPPVVKELIGHYGFDAQELQALHRAMGAYHAFQVEHLSRRLSDAIEAVYHYRCADEHAVADALARDVCDVYHAVSNFVGTKTITEEIVVRTEPLPPWWALNRYGMCQLRLGFPDSARNAFERALSLAPSPRDRGTTLNNLSQIYDARGDYDTALRYLEQSLQICRDIGDKAGEGTTLHNMGFIAFEAQAVEQALSLWKQALDIALEIREARLLFHTARTLGSVLARVGARDEAKALLQMAVQVGRQAGLPGVDEVEAMLRQLT
jgi:tetratricopeptide (TPR) repeat protein